MLARTAGETKKEREAGSASRCSVDVEDIGFVAEGGYDAPSGEERVAAAKIGLSEHLKSTVAMIALGALLKWIFADDDDWYNFRQSDWFEKMMLLASPKIGNTTIDLTGGEASFNRLVHQIATKSKRSGTGRL